MKHNIKIGDVIAFSGKGWLSRLIKFKTRSKISHVGIVSDIEMGGPIIMESTTLSDLPDHYTGEHRKGVQAHSLVEYIESYNGDIYLVSLKKHLTEKQVNSMQTWLLKKHEEKTLYDTKQAVGSVLDRLERYFKRLANKPDFKELFCSELVAKALKIVKRWDGNPSEQHPQDVIEFKCFERLIVPISR
jgi:hypothetical protein